MLTHRLMIAKRLYSILKRNVINRFARVFAFFVCVRAALCVCLRARKKKCKAGGGWKRQRAPSDTYENMSFAIV